MTLALRVRRQHARDEPSRQRTAAAVVRAHGDAAVDDGGTKSGGSGGG